MNIQEEVRSKKEIDLIKNLNIVGENDEVYCELRKVIYIADKSYFKEKKKNKKLQNESKN